MEAYLRLRDFYSWRQLSYVITRKCTLRKSISSDKAPLTYTTYTKFRLSLIFIAYYALPQSGALVTGAKKEVISPSKRRTYY